MNILRGEIMRIINAIKFILFALRFGWAFRDEEKEK